MAIFEREFRGQPGASQLVETKPNSWRDVFNRGVNNIASGEKALGATMMAIGAMVCLAAPPIGLQCVAGGALLFAGGSAAKARGATLGLSDNGGGKDQRASFTTNLKRELVKPW